MIARRVLFSAHGSGRRFQLPWLLTPLAGVAAAGLLASAGDSGSQVDRPQAASVAESVFAELHERHEATALTPAMREDPRAILERVLLLEDMLDALDRPASFHDTQALRRQAMYLAAEVDRPRLARELAREDYLAVVAHQEGTGQSPHKAAGRFAMRGDLIHFGLQATRPQDFSWVAAKGLVEGVIEPREVLPEDIETVTSDIREYVADWRAAGRFDTSTVTPSALHRTLLGCADHLRRFGHFGEASLVYEDAARYARDIGDADTIPIMNPAYCTAYAALAALENGDLDAATAHVEAIIGMPAHERHMRGHGTRSVAFYLNFVLVEGVSSGRQPEPQGCLDLVLPWLAQNIDREMNEDVLSLISYVGTFASRPGIAEHTARIALEQVDLALSSGGALERQNERYREYLTAQLGVGTTPSGYVLKPFTVSLLSSRFSLALRLGETDLAMEAAETILTEYPNAPAMPGVASWYRRQQSGEGVNP